MFETSWGKHSSTEALNRPMDDALVATSIFYTVYDFDFKMMQHGNLRVSKVLTNHPERNINIHGYPSNQMSALW